MAVRPRAIAVVVLVTVAVAVLSWCRPLVPGGYNWQRVQDALAVEEPRTLASWWTNVLYLTGTVSALGAAAVAWRPGRRLRGAAWALVAVCAVWMSLDHSVGMHVEAWRYTESRLPGLVGEYPIETGLAVLLVPAGVVLAWHSSLLQRLLLAGALTSYLVGSVVVNLALVDLPFSAHRTELTEACFEWVGIILLALAASLERRR